jgi:hypothetical protein
MAQRVLLMICAMFAASCVTTPEQQINEAASLALNTPFERIPELYLRLEREGKLPPEVRKSWMEAWQKQNAEYQRRLATANKRRANERASYSRTMMSNAQISRQRQRLDESYEQLSQSIAELEAMRDSMRTRTTRYRPDGLGGYRGSDGTRIRPDSSGGFRVTEPSQWRRELMGY